MKNIIISMLIIACFLLCACGETAQKDSEASRTVETEAVVSLDENAAETVHADPKTVTDGKFPSGQAIESLHASKGSGYYLISEGAYYVDGYSSAGRMSFADFATLNSFPVCSKPNCLHDDPEVCSAFGLSNGSDVMLCSYDGSLYIVENTREMSAKSGISSCANIYKADADGSERRKVATLDGYTLSSLYVFGNKGYTVAAEEIADENGLSTMEYNYYAESFDFKTNEIKNLGHISHLYMSDTVRIIGEYGGKIYYMSVGAEERPEGMSATSPDYFDSLHALTVTKIFSLDPEAENITESELPVPSDRESMNWAAPDIVAAAEGFYVCQQGDTAIIASPDGSVRKIENHRLTERAADYPVNGMMFNAETLLATELRTGDIYKLKAGAIRENEAIIAYYEGNYIAFGQFTREFRKILPAELFETEAVASDETSVINTNTHMSAHGGEFYTEQVMTAQFSDFRLNFTDFDTLKSTVVCSKPNCTHDDPEVCSAFGMGNHPTVVDGKIYFMKNDPEWGAEQTVNIFSADLDGTGRIRLAKIKNCASEPLTPIAIIGKTLYFTVTESEFNDDGFTESGLKTIRLCSFNCETGDAEILCELCKGYDTSAEIKGCFDGNLYVRVSYKNEKQEPLDFSSATDEDWSAYIAEGQKMTVNAYKTYDLAGGNLGDPPYEIDPLGEFFAGGGILCCQTGDKSVVVRQGEDALETDFVPNIGSCLVNGFLFSPFYGIALDTNTLEIRPLNADVVTSEDFVLDYRDGSYIVRTSIDYGSYRRVSPDELFEEE